MTRKLISFGLKHRKLPKGFTGVSARHLPNPHHQEELKALTGQDKRVQAWLSLSGATWSALCLKVRNLMLNEDKDVAVFCYGGRHRSVAVVEVVMDGLNYHGVEVNKEHMEL